jgi:hypothetical protein
MKETTLNKLVVAILVAVVIIVAGIVLLLNNKEDNLSNGNMEITNEKMLEIKESYEVSGKSEEFVILYNTLETAIANKFLDGTITTDEAFQEEINKINNILKTSNWEYLDVAYTDFWIGVWNLDSKGKLYFTFANDGIKPDWINETEIKEYVK